MNVVQNPSGFGSPASHAVIRAEVVACLEEYFIADIALLDDTLLVDDLGADSLDLLHVMQMINDMFNIEIDVDSLPRMLTVGGVCGVVEQLLFKG